MAPFSRHQQGWTERLVEARRKLQSTLSLDGLETVIGNVEILIHDANKWRFPRALRNEANILFVWAAYGYGAILFTIELRGGNQRNGNGKREPFLKSCGIDAIESSRWQKLSQFDIADVEWAINCIVIKDRDVTVSGVLRLLQGRQQACLDATTCQCQAATQIDSIVAALQREKPCHTTILVTPPWPKQLYGVRRINKSAAERRMENDLYRSWKTLPIIRACAKVAAIHVLAPDKLALMAMRLVEAWGFEYEGQCMWVHDDGKYRGCYQTIHTCLVLGLQGNFRFKSRWIKSVRESETDSISTGSLRKLLESTSAGPFLQVFGARSERRADGWTVIGRDET